MIFDSKNGLYYFLLPFVVAIVIALTVDQIFDKYILPRQNKISNVVKIKRLMYELHPEETPVFGSSKARSSLIPDSLGADVFNYGMESCNMDVIFFLLQLELEKDKDAPIIIEFNPRSFLHIPEHTIDISTFTPVLDDERVVEYLEENGRLDKYQTWPGVRYYGSYIGYLRNFLRKRTSDKRINRGGIFMDKFPGEEVFQTLIGLRLNKINRRKELEKMKADGEILTHKEKRELEYLSYFLDFANVPDRIERFNNILREHPNREFIIVFTPHHWSELEGVRNYEEIEELFKTWNEDFDNVTALNYGKFPLPDDHFKNSSHVNIHGARKFCSALIDDVRDIIPQ